MKKLVRVALILVAFLVLVMSGAAFGRAIPCWDRDAEYRENWSRGNNGVYSDNDILSKIKWDGFEGMSYLKEHMAEDYAYGRCNEFGKWVAIFHNRFSDFDL